MDIVLMILYLGIVLTVLVFVHECGHYFAARIFGVRVTEFMLGLPAPSIGFTWKGTRFGITALPLIGGYARICGMGQQEPSPHLEKVLAFAYQKGTVIMEEVAEHLLITNDEAYAALEELSEWGSLIAPSKKDAYNTYRTPAEKGKYELGQQRVVEDEHAFYESEYKQQYCSKPFWKRFVMLIGGIVFNLLFTIITFVVIFSVIGVDAVNPATGLVEHFRLSVFDSITRGFQMIGMVFVAVAGLFNPATAAETVSQSTSVVGMAVMSKSFADAGLLNFVFFIALISISLGIMNLIPIPPLDGGRIVVEIFQKITGKRVPVKVMNYLSMIGLLLILLLVAVLVSQDIQRGLTGFWSGQ